MSNKAPQKPMQRPQTAVNPERSSDPYRKPEMTTEFDLMKFLDTYKRGVDFYNSYGLKKDDKKAESNKPNTKKMNSTTSFWDLNWTKW